MIYRRTLTAHGARRRCCARILTFRSLNASHRNIGALPLSGEWKVDKLRIYCSAYDNDSRFERELSKRKICIINSFSIRPPLKSIPYRRSISWDIIWYRSITNSGNIVSTHLGTRLIRRLNWRYSKRSVHFFKNNKIIKSFTAMAFFLCCISSRDDALL